MATSANKQNFACFFPETPAPDAGPTSVSRLDALAQAMIDGFDAENAAPGLAPAYPFFLAFVANDLARMTGEALKRIDESFPAPLDRANAGKMLSNRISAPLSLETVYGGAGSDLEGAVPRDPARPGRLLTGAAAPDDPLAPDVAGADLPRLAGFADRGEAGTVRFRDGDDPVHLGRAVIADRRNERHLGLAQLHAAFLRLHNLAVGRCERMDLLTGNPDALLAWGREEVVACYRWLIRRDLLPALCDPATLSEVLRGKAALFRSFRRQAAPPALPLECVGTLDLLVSAMLPARLDWNRWFGRDGRNPARLEDLFAMTGEARPPFGGFSETAAPGIWVADWGRLSQSGGARPITASISPALPVAARRLRNYGAQRIGDPVRRALRLGHLLALPEGRAPPEAGFTGGHTGRALVATGLADGPPLGFFILKEAETWSGGACLGPVGTRILANTLIGVLQETDPGGRWTRPEPPVLAGAPVASLRDLLLLA